MSRSELYQNAIEAFLLECREEGITNALNASYAEDEETSSVDPLLSRLQVGTLESDD